MTAPVGVMELPQPVRPGALLRVPWGCHRHNLGGLHVLHWTPPLSRRCIKMAEAAGIPPMVVFHIQMPIYPVSGLCGWRGVLAVGLEGR